MAITPPGSGGGGNPPIIDASNPSPKHDIYGTTMTRGVSSNRFDRAVVRCLVSNVPNDYTGLSTAINAAIPNREHHHSILNLPLGYAKATRFGPSKVWVDLYYQRGRVTAPTQDAQLVASFRGTHEHTIVYREDHVPQSGDPVWHNGLPSGKVYFDENKEPVGRAWRRPVIKIYVTDIVLGAHPFQAVAGALGRVNPDDQYTIGNFVFPPLSLRFDSVDVDWIEIYNPQEPNNPTPAFVTDYVFSATPGGWYYQQASYDGSVWSVTGGEGDGSAPNRPEFETWNDDLRFPWQP